MTHRQSRRPETAEARTSNAERISGFPAGEELSAKRAELAVQLFAFLVDGLRDARQHTEADSLEHVLDAANDHLMRMQDLDGDR